MNENKNTNVADTLQNVPEYEKLTDDEKLILVMTIKKMLSQHTITTKKEKAHV